MFSLNQNHRFYLYHQATDMRKSFDGLSGLVTNQLGRNPLSGEVFVFVNRRRNCIKLLHWEAGGFVLYYKRLEKGTLEFPRLNDKKNGQEISWPQLVMIIEGISLKSIQKRKRYL